MRQAVLLLALFAFVAPVQSQDSLDELIDTAPWKLIFRQTNGTWLDKDEWTSVNPGDPDASDYSILDNLDDYRVKNGPYNGSFFFKLVWPGSENCNGTNVWTQTSNPVTKTEGGVDNYQELRVSYSGYYWGGLEYNWASNKCLLDHSADHKYYWYAIGATKIFKKNNGHWGIPGCVHGDKTGFVVEKTELYVFDESAAAEWKDYDDVVCKDVTSYDSDASYNGNNDGFYNRHTFHGDNCTLAYCQAHCLKTLKGECYAVEFYDKSTRADNAKDQCRCDVFKDDVTHWKTKTGRMCSVNLARQSELSGKYSSADAVSSQSERSVVTAMNLLVVCGACCAFGAVALFLSKKLRAQAPVETEYVKLLASDVELPKN